MATRGTSSAKKLGPTRSVTPTKPIVGTARTPNKNVGSRIDTGLSALAKSGLTTPPPGNSQSKKENLSPLAASSVQKQKTNLTDSKISNKLAGNTSVSPTKFPDYTEPKKIQGLVTGRDRKLRDHNKCKIFREVVTNLFETRIEPAKLLYFLGNKCKEKKDMFNYDYARDTNVMNLRFCIYLLAEELETIINNLDESHGHNYINSIDAKLTKRNEIINYLLKEKAVTCKLFTKMLSVFMNTVSECGDLMSLVEGAADFKDKGRLVSKLKTLTNELQIIDEFKSFAKTYFTEKDVGNLVALQRDIKDPMSRDQYLKIIDYPTIFERVDKYQQLLEEYRTLSNDMALKEENYNRLLKKYDQLLKDFTDLTNQGTKQIVNPLGPEDYNLIFAKYKEVKEQERQEQEAAKKLANKKKRSSRSGSKKSKKGDKDGKKSKRKDSQSPKRDKSKKKTKKRKASQADEDMTSDRSRSNSPEETERDRKRPASAMKARDSLKGDEVHKHVKIMDKPATEKQHQPMARVNIPAQRSPDPNLTYEYSPNNSGIGTFRGKEPPPPEIDVSHISRKDNSFGEMFQRDLKKEGREGASNPPEANARRKNSKEDDPFMVKKDDPSNKQKRDSLKPAEFSQPSISAKKEESVSHHGHSITVTPPKSETPKHANPPDINPASNPSNPPPPPPPKQPTPPLTPKSETQAKPPTPPQPATPPKPGTPKGTVNAAAPANPPPPPPAVPSTPKANTPPAPASPKTAPPPPPPAPPSPKTTPPPPPSAAVPPPPPPGPPPPPSQSVPPPPPPGLLGANNSTSNAAGNNSSFI